MTKNKLFLFTTLCGLASFITVISNLALFDGTWSTICMIVFSALIPIFAFTFRNNTIAGLLLTTFPTIIVVRNADQHDWSIVGWISAIVFIPLLLQLISIAQQQYHEKGGQPLALSLIRMFVGLNWLTHCTEKLFLSHHDDGLVNFFSTVVGPNTIGSNIPPHLAHYVIIFGGLVELSIAIFLGLGLFTRLGAFFAACYLIAAQLMSGHFMVGYTWALPGGGWELCFFFFMVMYPFMLAKTAGPISLDSVFKTNKMTHPILKSLSGN